jgi:hypothetical protein
MSTKFRFILRPGLLTAALSLAGLLPAAAGPRATPAAPQPPPVARQGAEQASPPGLLTRELHRPPALVGSGQLARENTRAFISWASLSAPSEREDARREIAAAASNPEIARAVIEDVRSSYQGDHSRALIGLAILGELRGPEGEGFLREFVRMPLPREGTVVEGEILEQTALATLQAKAVDGLAFLRTPEADAEVLRLAGEHESIIVRAEAISAWLWNHGDTAEARKALEPRVRPEERIFLNRVRRVSGESAESFDGKLKAFLEAHPEAIPPAPQSRPRNTPEKE